MIDTATWNAAFARLAAESSRSRGTLLLWVGLVGLFLATASYGSVSGDVSAAYLPAWEVAQHHTANSDNFGGLTQWLHPIHGHLRSDRFAGVILVAVPAYWLFGGPDALTIGPSALTVALLAATSVAVMHRTLLRLVPAGWALAGALVFGLGTATWTVSADAQWTHTVTQLGLTLVMYSLAARRPWLGALGMVFAASARPHTALVAAILGLADFWRTRKFATIVLLALGSVGGLAVVYWWSGATLGHAGILPATYAGRGANVQTAGSTHYYGWPENLAGFVVSPERGVLVLCPFIVPCVFGLRRAWRSAPGWTKDAAVSGIAYSLLQLGVNGFAGGWGFYSFRLAIEGVTLATPLLVLGAREACRDHRWAWATAVLVGYSISVHTLGAFWYTNGNEGPVWWTRYQPAQLAIDAPWHAVVAVVVGVGVTMLLVGLARSDADPDVVTDARVAEVAA